MKLSENIQNKFRCPRTKEKLKLKGNFLVSVADPGIKYPLIDNVPVLINEENSLFSVDDFINKTDTTFCVHKSPLKIFLGKIKNFLQPDISLNIKAEETYQELASLLPKNAAILVIGGSIKGNGMDAIYANKSYEIVSSDVSFGPYVGIISDAHDIPFEEGTFDCVIIQAVLEHVLDPHRCISEVHRVLKPSGMVYADTPFMQQVHMKQYDFTRFTHLGHRRLFRNFEEINSGPSCGPGMALAWAYKSFLTSFATTRQVERLLLFFAAITSFYLKYFDYYLINKPGSYDSAAAFFFIGKKSNDCLPDKELIKQFKGKK
ncbi:MAG: class I SAM-dependent methyltransferase [Kangiella sp.]|nr:class I SAM-dependent methyltransferase [Kangiella sp.]